MNGQLGAAAPGLRMPMQSVPVTRSRSAAALAGGAGVEASSLFGFLDDLVHLDFQHMYDSVVDDVIDWVTS